MNCQKCKIEIEERDSRREYLSNAAEIHLEGCASCRAFGEERLALRRLVGGLERVSAPADFEFRIRARMAAERGVGASRAAWLTFSPAGLSWPLAGCLALVISASLYFQPRPGASGTASTTPADQPVAAATTQSTQSRVAETVPPDYRDASVETQSGMVVASFKSSAAQRRRALPSRLAGRTGIERELRPVEESTSTSLTAATPRIAMSGATRNESALIPVQLDAPEGQLKVLLRDTSGGARTISVDSVSFGSRDVIGRPGATYTKASLSANEGVW
jgi:hypothetical protein